MARRHLGKERLEAQGRHQADLEPAMHSDSKKAQEHPRLHHEDHCHQAKGGAPSSLLSPNETHLECWDPRTRRTLDKTEQL